MDKPSDAFAKEYGKKDYYILSSEYHGTVRLALQQFIWRQALGFNIHPSIPELPADAKIADVATGTGLWSVDVCHELGSEVTLDAFDITFDQAPPKEWLPKNMHLHKWNMFDEPPAHLQSRYDLVHVRLITVVINNQDPNVVVRNFSKLLKPGGWLQWDEVEVFDSFVVKSSPDLQVPHMERWCQWMAGPKKENQADVSTLWKNRLAENLHSNGFEGAYRHDHLKDFIQHMPLMRYNSDQLLMLSEQYAQRVYAQGNEMGPKLRGIVQEAAKDATKGSCMIMPPFSWTARKLL